MWHFTSFKTAGEVHLPSIICGNARLPIPNALSAWNMNRSHYPAGWRPNQPRFTTRAHLNFLWREHSQLPHLPFSPPAPFSPTNHNSQNSSLKGLLLPQRAGNTHYVSCFLPLPRIANTSFSTLRTKSWTEYFPMKIKNRKLSSTPPLSYCWNSARGSALRSLRKCKDSELRNMFRGRRV